MKLSMLAGPEVAVPPGCGEVEIAGITADSRAVRPGWLFAALAGAKTDGARFVADAIGKGAAAILMRSGAAAERARRRAGADLSPEPRRALALMAARLFPRPARNHGRCDRHQRQDLGGRVHAPDLRRARTQGRLARHHRPGEAQRQRLRRADHARPGGAASHVVGARRRGHHAPRVRGVLARARPVPARWRAAEGGRLHQPRPRPPRLSPEHGGLSRRQAAPVHRAAAARTAWPWSTPTANMRATSSPPPEVPAVQLPRPSARPATR